MHDVSDKKGGSQTTDTHRLELENDEIRRLYKEKVSRHWRTHNTSSQMTRRVNKPCSLILTRSKTRNEFLYGPQMAVPVPQSRSDTEPSTLLHGGLRRGLEDALDTKCSSLNIASQYGATNPLLGQQRQVGYQYPPETVPKAPDKQNSGLEEAINAKRSYMNIIPHRELTNASMSTHRGSMKSYPPYIVPKAPDKWPCRINDRQNVEVHNAPQTVVVDGVKHHPLYKRDVLQRQQSVRATSRSEP
jgi:hypothetical protein